VNARARNSDPKPWVARAFDALDHCETLAEAFDVDNERYIRDNVLGRQLTITSARKMPSDYHDGNYAVIGFTDHLGRSGLFSIGGNGRLMPLALSRLGKLPVHHMMLYSVPTPYGPVYKWRRLG
jgi:hypothetical protein